MLQLVSDLLDTAIIDRRQVQIERQVTSLVKVIQNVTDELHAQMVRKNQRLLVRGPVDLKWSADPARMKQVMANLISNAIKYSPAGSEINIQMSESDGWSRVAIKDRGPGLSRAERELIFDSFTRVKKPTTGGESSTGLGLSISKSLVELNGGRLMVESDGLGHGSTFTVELPSA